MRAAWRFDERNKQKEKFLNSLNDSGESLKAQCFHQGYLTIAIYEKENML